MSFEMLLKRTGSRSRRGVGLLAPVLLLFGLTLQAQPAAADNYEVFYYNAKGELLHVEVVDVATAESTRTLQDINATNMVVPMVTEKVIPKFTGTNAKMSKFAVIAVYYKDLKVPRPAIGDQNIQAVPVKVEDLQFVASRTLETCVSRSPAAPCAYPKRCHCMTLCCCY